MAGNSLKSYFHLKSEPAMPLVILELYFFYAFRSKNYSCIIHSLIFLFLEFIRRRKIRRNRFFIFLWRHIFFKTSIFFVFQLTDALTFLHVSCRYVHRNVCPNSVYVTKSGSWKLGSLEFMGEWRFSKYILKLSILFIHTTTNSRRETRKNLKKFW